MAPAGACTCMNALSGQKSSHVSTNDPKTSFCLAGSPNEQVSAMLSIAADWVAEAVDKERGADVTDPSIYRAHAQKYEVRM